MDDVNLWIAFWAGVVSFVSPCCLPLYPSYLSYISGISVSELKQGVGARVRAQTMLHTLFFLLGLSLIYYVVTYTASFVGGLFVDHAELIRQLSAVFIIAMGLVLLGIFRPELLMKEFKFQFMRKPAGYFGSFLFGIGFAAGWSPCIGPILGAIGALAASEPTAWLTLTTAYTLGFAVPFFALAFFIGSTKWIVRFSGIITKIGGAVMIVIGVALFTGHLTKLSVWLQSITPSWIG